MTERAQGELAAAGGLRGLKEMSMLLSHTRHTHAMLDGQKCPTDEPFVVGGRKIMYPGDPNAAPDLVYNCRCTLIADVTEWPAEGATRRDNETGERVADITYEKWVAQKKSLQDSKNPAKMKWKEAMFKTKAFENKHYKKHASEYGEITRSWYIERARRLLCMKESDDVVSFVRTDGSISVYRYSTNEFAVGTKEGHICTAFKPKDGSVYWEEELTRNG